MLVDELITECRVRLDDAVAPYLQPTDDLIRWINEAQHEACRRARILSDARAKVNVVAGRATYNNPGKTIQIRRARLLLDELPLVFTGSRDMDEDVPGWENHTGTPTDVITDLSSDKFTLYPIPIVSDTLMMTIIKEPDDITDEDDTLQIPSRFHYSLVDYVLFRAYSVAEKDMGDKQKAADSLALFEQEFGTRSSAKDEVFNIRQMPYNNSDGYY